MKVSRNAPCPCGSGKKYKHCCLGLENTQMGTVAPRVERTRTISILTAIGAALTAAAWYAEDLSLAITVAGASAVLGVGYLIFTNPPPPRKDAGNPAGLDFGRKD